MVLVLALKGRGRISNTQHTLHTSALHLLALPKPKFGWLVGDLASTRSHPAGKMLGARCHQQPAAKCSGRSAAASLHPAAARCAVSRVARRALAVQVGARVPPAATPSPQLAHSTCQVSNSAIHTCTSLSLPWILPPPPPSSTTNKTGPRSSWCRSCACSL